MNRNEGTNNLAEFCAPGTSFREKCLELSDGVMLRVVSFYPAVTPHPLPVVMVPGLVSVMLTFKPILLELTRHFTVHYVKTREKSSSRVARSASFDVATFGSDLAEVVSKLPLEEEGYIFFGASLGATAIIDGFSRLSKRPFCLVLLEPNAVFDYPRWSLPIIRLAAPFYPLIKPVAKWYLKKFRVNTAEDYEMYRISSRALDAADPYKLRDTILDIAPYQIWDHLASIDIPTLVVCASKDKFHRHGDIERIVSQIRNCTLIDLEIHKRTHSAEFGECLRNFVNLLMESG